MENFTMMLGYNPEVTYTRFYQEEQSVITQLYSRKPKKIIQMFFKRSVSFLYCIINSPDIFNLLYSINLVMILSKRLSLPLVLPDKRARLIWSVGKC